MSQATAKPEHPAPWWLPLVLPGFFFFIFWSWAEWPLGGEKLAMVVLAWGFLYGVPKLMHMLIHKDTGLLRKSIAAVNVCGALFVLLWVAVVVTGFFKWGCWVVFGSILPGLILYHVWGAVRGQETG